MQLNEHGWGLKEMLIWVVLILVFLLISVFYISKLYTGIDSKNYEKDVIYATKEYINNTYGNDNIPENMYIPITVLDEETDYNFKKCTGYVETTIVDGEVKIDNKVVCNNG